MPKKIMVVDDDDTMNSLLKMLLEFDGFVVTLMPDGSFVLPSALKEKPDALLMDVHIGGVDGLQVLRQLRQHPDLKTLPVIMASGMDLEDQCAAAGASAFILKPYPPDQL